MTAKDVKVIGAGLGGLSAACLMASRGHSVTVIEKNEEAGGKINQIRANGFRFDTGPSLLTMPFILDELFKSCGADKDDYLELRPVEPICTYFFSDGSRFHCYHDLEKTMAEVEDLAPEDLESYRGFMQYSAKLYERTKDAFLFNPLYRIRDFISVNPADFLRIDAFTTVSDRVDDYFDSPHLRQFFKRFTTYNGSSPFQAPATLNVIAHVELAMGGYYIKGGMYSLVTALSKLAKSLGVDFVFGNEVDNILLRGSSVRGLQLNDGRELEADLVISNSDAAETYTRLLPEAAVSGRKRHRIKSMEPSCSGFVLLLGIDRKYEKLGHHNIFFSADYEQEFRQIFRDKVMPGDPTIYIANTSYSDPGDAPEGGSNLFVLVNAPYLSEKWDWKEQEESYAAKIITHLEGRGLEGLRRHIRFNHTITPVDFYQQYRSNKGSIYGTSSNSRMSAFVRPRNKSTEVEGLYLVGGSTHPGGGIPLVILSAMHAQKLINRE